MVAAMAMTLRTDSELEAALDALSKAEGVSKQETIRRAVLEKHARSAHMGEVSKVADEMLERWGDVLDRLGRA
jgi:predicted transcriptional regulator